MQNTVPQGFKGARTAKKLHHAGGFGSGCGALADMR